MEFRDLKQQYQLHKNQIDNAILRVVNDTNFISGRQVMNWKKIWQSMWE